jgi:hypothetical protein
MGYSTTSTPESSIFDKRFGLFLFFSFFQSNRFRQRSALPLLCGKLPNKRHEERFKVEVCAAALLKLF